MSEKMKDQVAPKARRSGGRRVELDASNGRAADESSVLCAADEDLKVLLSSWQSPRMSVPASLDARVLNSYRELVKEKEMNLHHSDNLAPQYALPSTAGAGAHADYQLTILEERGLLMRLLAEMRETARDAELTRAEFRRDPFNFMRRLSAAYGSMMWRTLRQENTAYGIAAAFVAVLTLVGAVAALDGFQRREGSLLAERLREDLVYLGSVTEIPREQPKPDEGTAGLAKGAGGGSKPLQERPGGGGGGGRHEDKPAVNGKLPQATFLPQVLAPDPHPPKIQNPSLPTAATIQADPILFPTDTRAINYGDPKSKATELSSGSGDGNGIGEGKGGGVGAGRGTGYGPGEGYNTGGGPAKPGGGGEGGNGGIDYGRNFRVNEVTRKASITSKPEPLYTEEARKNQVTGTVRLRLVLSASGQVTGITPLTKLPDGLTEKAIEAARRIAFIPAEKDGRKVSQYVTIEYNFNIY
ncbi:MAG TPA: energy transducer TonB [Pyrinomonadaceae bacterium]|jgi:TonB family protein|nr:energy transducer TonB [Pyrinomonadaceae bacterium]